MDGLNKTIRIYAQKYSEEDILGLLLERYVEGTTYNKETKIWSVPNEVYDEIVSHKNVSPE